MKIIASLLFMLLILLQMQLWFSAHGVFQLWSIRNTIEQTQAQNNALIQRNEQLNSQVLELKDGKEALEERARSQLGFIKDGEIFYRVIPPSNQSEQ